MISDPPRVLALPQRHPELLLPLDELLQIRLTYLHPPSIGSPNATKGIDGQIPERLISRSGMPPESDLRQGHVFLCRDDRAGERGSPRLSGLVRPG